MADTHFHSALRPRERLAAMTPEGRQLAYEEGGFSRAERSAWAAMFPEEVPTVNDELPWIAFASADLD